MTWHIEQAKIHEFEESAKSTASAAQHKAAGAANAAHDQASDAAGQAQCQAHRAQEESAGLIQQVHFIIFDVIISKEYVIKIYIYFFYGVYRPERRWPTWLREPSTG